MITTTTTTITTCEVIGRQAMCPSGSQCSIIRRTKIPGDWRDPGRAGQHCLQVTRMDPDSFPPLRIRPLWHTINGRPLFGLEVGSLCFLQTGPLSRLCPAGVPDMDEKTGNCSWLCWEGYRALWPRAFQMIEFNICSRASGFLTTQFLELKQETPMVFHGAEWVQRSAVWYHLHHDGHMDAELGRPCPTSMSPFDPSPRTKLLIPPILSRNGTAYYSRGLRISQYWWRYAYMDQPKSTIHYLKPIERALWQDGLWLAMLYNRQHELLW